MLLVVQLLLLLTLTVSTDGFCYYMTEECITSSADLSDAEYIETFYFNRDPYVQFNSTVGEYVGFNEYGVDLAGDWNSNPDLLEWMTARLDTYCKPNLQLDYSAILDKSVKPKVRLLLEKSSKDGQPDMLICSAYKFYPPAIDVSWLIDGKKVTPDLVSTEVKPNGNWHYTAHSHLEYTPKSGEQISCVVEHTSSNGPIIYDWIGSPPEFNMPDVIKFAVGASGLALGIILPVAGFIYYRKKKSSGRTLTSL